jgi:HK97 family phage major capsid protein
MSQYDYQAAVKAVIADNDKYAAQVTQVLDTYEEKISKIGKNLNQHDIQIRTLDSEFLELQQKGGAISDASSFNRSSPVSIARKFRDSDQIQDYISGRIKSAGLTIKSGDILPDIQMNTIVTADPTSPPQQLPNVVGGPEKRLGLRQMFQNIPATGGSFTYQKELVYTNSAEAQVGDAAEKAESGLTFEEKVQTISTYAHWLKVSKQVLSDAPQTVDFTARRLIHGLESKIENAILNGDGTSSKLSGLLDSGNFTAHSPAGGSDGLENLRAAKKALQAADFDCNLFILNPTDAEAIDVIQDSTGQYVYGDPRAADGTVIWGTPVFISTYLTAGQFVALDRFQAATVHQRADALITLSDSDDDNFTKNLSTMLCEARLGFAVHHAAGIISGDLNGA